MSVLLIRIPASYFVDTDRLILKFIWRCKRPRIANSTLKEKNKVRGPTLLNFKTYCKAYSNQDSVGDFPGGSVVKTPHSHAGGEGSIPGRGTKIPYAAQYSQKKKKKTPL